MRIGCNLHKEDVQGPFQEVNIVLDKDVGESGSSSFDDEEGKE
jgi:hypothetical protein